MRIRVFGDSSDFTKFMVCQYETGVLSQCGHFADKGGQFL